MDYAKMHIENRNLSINIIPPMNHVRTCEKIHLPCELIGLVRNKKITEFREELKISSI